MKLAKHLAIFILLALNAPAQWHDAAPFVAWPATNHLRWVDNVGVYTNVSNWQTNGYGGWTNNFVWTNRWGGTDLYGNAYLAPWYVKELLGGPRATNSAYNAKDIRTLDCVLAMLERHLVLSPANTVSNFLREPVLSSPLTSIEAWLYRDDISNIQWMKDWVFQHFSSFYYTTNGWTNAIAFNETNLCNYASVPTNFLRYTPYRAADMSYTATNGYSRIITNTFILGQGTNATHYATNSLVDSAGIDFTVMGTNGTLITRYATNTSLQAGYNLPAYGWDGLRRVITSLVATVSTPTWGIGEGTNWSGGYSSNFTHSALVNFTAGTVGAEVDWPTIEAAATAANGNLPYNWDGGVIPWDEWDWEFNASLTNAVVFSKTNTAPYFKAASSFDFQQTLNGRHTAEGHVEGGSNLLDSATWTVETDARTHSRYYTNDWSNYAAPLVTVSANTNFGKTVIVYAKSNTVSFLVDSNSIFAGVAGYTSTPVRLQQPVLTNWGFDSATASSYAGGWNGTTTPGSSPMFYLSSFMTAYGKYLWSTDPRPGWDETDHPSASTNIAPPTITADKAVEIWDFKYK